VRFCEGLPLVPTLQEVTRYLAGQQVERRRATLKRIRASLKDDPGEDELTFFLTKGENLKDWSHPSGKEVRQAVGFFLYTQCAGNRRGEWPSLVGAFVLCWMTHACYFSQLQPASDSSTAHAASTGFEEAAGYTPVKWVPDDPLLPLKLAGLFKFEVYKSACLYCDSYVTSKAYNAQKTRDNKWVTFQHHLHECALSPSPNCTCATMLTAMEAARRVLCLLNYMIAAPTSL
jgi:hypothetical protein